MEMVLENSDIRKNFDAKYIVMFNKCRMFARVILTSDLTVPDSNTVDPEIFKLTT